MVIPMVIEVLIVDHPLQLSWLRSLTRSITFRYELRRAGRLQPVQPSMLVRFDRFLVDDPKSEPRMIHLQNMP